MVVVGIDSAKDRVDMVVMVGGHIIRKHSVDAPKGSTRGEALTYMSTQVAYHLRTLRNDYSMEVVVFVEDAIVVRSPRVAIQLGQTVGMLLALPYRVYEVPIDSWKQVLCGKGGIGKDVVKASVIQRWPHAEQLYGKRQDLFDATGVAFYGESVLGRRL